MNELPQASAVLEAIRNLLGRGGSVRMRDYGHGLGAVHVTLAHWLNPAAKEFYTSNDWEYVGPGVQLIEDDTAAIPSLEFSRWVRLDGCSF